MQKFGSAAFGCAKNTPSLDGNLSLTVISFTYEAIDPNFTACNLD